MEVVEKETLKGKWDEESRNPKSCPPKFIIPSVRKEKEKEAGIQDLPSKVHFHKCRATTGAQNYRQNMIEYILGKCTHWSVQRLLGKKSAFLVCPANPSTSTHPRFMLGAAWKPNCEMKVGNKQESKILPSWRQCALLGLELLTFSHSYSSKVWDTWNWIQHHHCKGTFVQNEGYPHDSPCYKSLIISPAEFRLLGFRVDNLSKQDTFFCKKCIPHMQVQQ